MTDILKNKYIVYFIDVESIVRFGDSIFISKELNKLPPKFHPRASMPSMKGVADAAKGRK